jgi:hypothetical protein
MDKTESAVRNMLTAIEAPLYDVGVLGDRGMLPGLDGITAAAVLGRLALLKYSNAQGSHIYIRPSGEHRFYAWRNLSKFAKTLQKGQLITLEGTLRYREVEDEIEGTTFKHRIAEIHAITMKRLSKIEAADDPADGAGDE